MPKLLEEGAVAKAKAGRALLYPILKKIIKKRLVQISPFLVKIAAVRFPPLSRLVLLAGLFSVQILRLPAQEADSSSPFVDSRFDSDISQPLRFRDDLLNGPSSPPAFSRYRFEILPAPIQQAQNDEMLLPDPTPTPVPVPTAVPSPTLIPIPTPSVPRVPQPSVTPVPFPSPTPISTPVPSPSPGITRTPAFPVPPPNPAPRVQLPLVPPPAPSSAAPSLLQIQRLTPIVEIWRAGAVSPQVPIRHGSYMGTAFIGGNESAMVRLHFDPLIAGKIVTVSASAAIILDPAQTGRVVQPTGDCTVTVGLAGGFNRGYVNFYCQGLQTTLPLQRSSLVVVSTQEKEIAR
ncbi:MAG: hypothetical protein V7609_1569 [Verrucomicrobiota bacterium]